MTISSIPPVTDPLWNDIVTGQVTKKWQILVIEIMMTRIATSLKNDPSPDNLQKCIEEVHGFFERNLAVAQADLEGLF